jgi:hypothetical protein
VYAYIYIIQIYIYNIYVVRRRIRLIISAYVCVFIYKNGEREARLRRAEAAGAMAGKAVILN